MKKRVQFWEILDSADRTPKSPTPTDIIHTLKDAKAKSKNRHWICKNGMKVLCNPLDHHSEPILILDRVRSDNFPSQGDADGNRIPLEIDKEGALLEPTFAMFLDGGILAVLTGGDGPHAQRIIEYINAKFDCSWRLVPVLRGKLYEVLDQMRITEFSFSVPADSIDRELVGGSAMGALAMGAELANGGVVKIGMSVGRKGNASYKERMSRHFRGIVEEIRGSRSLAEFNSAKVRGVVDGNPTTVDLIQDQLAYTTEVDAEEWFDIDRLALAARDALCYAVERSRFSDQLISPGNGKIIKFKEDISLKEDE